MKLLQVPPILKQMDGDAKRLQQLQRMLGEKIDAVCYSWSWIEGKAIVCDMDRSVDCYYR